MDSSGQWLASGGDDGTLRLWEVRTGRCLRTWPLGGLVRCVAWCPAPETRLLSAVVGKSVVLLPAGEIHELFAMLCAQDLGRRRLQAQNSGLLCSCACA